MIGIAYLSTAAHRPTTSEIADILSVSRKNNEARDITGLLCHHDGSFLQFLEGPEAAVDETYLRIAADRRHEALIELYRETRQARLFADWSMAIVEPATLGPEMAGFVQGLRRVQAGATRAHALAVAPFLDAFRGWLR